MRKIELFYDIISPYSYLAFEVLERYRRLWDLELVLRPAFLGGVFKATGNQPPVSLAARASHLAHDLRRNSKYCEVVLGFPDGFPSNTLNTMRFLTLVKQAQPQQLSAVSRALWQRHWGEGKEVSSPEALGSACVVAGVDVGLVDRIAEQEVKDLLKAATDEAVARGAFGFPAVFTLHEGEDQLFFGSDRLNVLAFELGLPWHGPVPNR